MTCPTGCHYAIELRYWRGVAGAPVHAAAEEFIVSHLVVRDCLVKLGHIDVGERHHGAGLRVGLPLQYLAMRHQDRQPSIVVITQVCIGGRERPLHAIGQGQHVVAEETAAVVEMEQAQQSRCNVDL